MHAADSQCSRRIAILSRFSRREPPRRGKPKSPLFSLGALVSLSLGALGGPPGTHPARSGIARRSTAFPEAAKIAKGAKIAKSPERLAAWHHTAYHPEFFGLDRCDGREISTAKQAGLHPDVLERKLASAVQVPASQLQFVRA